MVLVLRVYTRIEVFLYTSHSLLKALLIKAKEKEIV